jgi:hypothetical protein
LDQLTLRSLRLRRVLAFGAVTWRLKDKLYSGEIDPYHFLGGMIDSTESMAEDEKGYWFDILPSMNYPQIARLVDILATERRKLRLLEIKYQKEIKELNARHLAKRKSGQAIE